MSAHYLLLIPFIIMLDQWLGEPKRWHPLIGFGWLAHQIESYCYPKIKTKKRLFAVGVIGWWVLVLPLAVGVYWLEQWLGFIVSLLVGYWAIGATSLKQHALQIANALQNNDLPEARIKVGYIVSRHTHELDEEAISRATIESVLENGSDAIFSALFWFAIAGAPGVLIYRLSNTLDAMWGYRNERYEYFGKYAARTDDVLNWLPARLSALSYLLVGQSKTAWQCWRRQANTWYSTNAGVVMATGAGALNVLLGGEACYHGVIKSRPILGLGNTPHWRDINRAWWLVYRSMWLWVVACLMLYCFISVLS